MKINDLIRFFEEITPSGSQENYDNSGLIVGNPDTKIKGVLICLDCIEATINEAVQKGCNLIIAHHPIVFKGLKTLTGSNYIERTVISAIKNDIAIFALHTNLDNYQFGVNFQIGKILGLKNLKILSPKKETLRKIVCYVPATHLESVSTSMYSAGAGIIGNYAECSFQLSGKGTYKPINDAKPFEGQLNIRSEVDEVRLEVLCSIYTVNKVLQSMKNAHPYEEVAYEIYSLENKNQFEGSGMIGELKAETDSLEFLKMLKERFKCACVRHTELVFKNVKTIAFCGGSGSFLLEKAKKSGADIFITGDFKYHEFFDADKEIIIADIGHFESEQYTIQLIEDILMKNFPTFAVHLTEVKTNPINYL